MALTLSGAPSESPGERRRLELNEDKILQVWEQWARRRDAEIPRYSTPKRHAVIASALSENVHRRSVTRARETGRSTCFLAIRRTIGKMKKPRSAISEPLTNEAVSHVRKSASEGDLQSITPFASLENCFVVRSEPDLRASCVSWVVTGSARPVSTSGHQNHGSCFERRETYRSSSCPDVVRGGRPVDESMTEFLANVDKDNLNSFLNFYEKMTGVSLPKKNALP